MLEITWQNIESVIKRLTELGLFKWIHYVKLENSLVHDVSWDIVGQWTLLPERKSVKVEQIQEPWQFS